MRLYKISAHNFLSVLTLTKTLILILDGLVCFACVNAKSHEECNKKKVLCDKASFKSSHSLAHQPIPDLSLSDVIGEKPLKVAKSQLHD